MLGNGANLARKAMLLGLLLLWMVGARAQKSCVIASAEDHVPIREALIHTDNNHWARTDYRGYFTMRYQFDSATVSKPGFVKTTIYLKNLPDTVFLLPQSHQIGEVTVWGKDQEHVRQMEEDIQNKVNSIPTSPTGIGFDAFGWMDKQGRRDQKHLKKAKEIFKQMDRKDPIVSAYEKATGKKYEINPEQKFSATNQKYQFSTPVEDSSQGKEQEAKTPELENANKPENGEKIEGEE